MGLFYVLQITLFRCTAFQKYHVAHRFMLNTYWCNCLNRIHIHKYFMVPFGGIHVYVSKSVNVYSVVVYLSVCLSTLSECTELSGLNQNIASKSLWCAPTQKLNLNWIFVWADSLAVSDWLAWLTSNTLNGYLFCMSVVHIISLSFICFAFNIL